MKTYQFTAQIEKDPDTGMYIGIIPNLPGAHSQASSLDELHKNLTEVIQLCIEEISEEELKQLPEFIGMQQFSVAV